MLHLLPDAGEEWYPDEWLHVFRQVLTLCHVPDIDVIVRTADGMHVDFPVRQGSKRSFAGRQLPSGEDARAVLTELGITPEREAALRAAGALCEWS